MKIVTFIQARMISTRLPQKVMLSICEKPLLYRIYERVKYARYPGEVVIITSDTKEDDAIVKLCEKENMPVFRGHLTDLLDRHYRAAIEYSADAVVKIPSDCPLIDSHVIDRVIKHFIDNYNTVDYVSNLHPASYPDGNDVEIFSMQALERCWAQAERPLEREHTTPFIWENPDKFRIANIEWENGIDLSSTHRWTIDYEEDYMFIRSVFQELYYSNPKFGLENIMNLLDQKPYLKNINRKYAGRYWYENYMQELKHIEQFKKNYKRVSNAQ